MSHSAQPSHREHKQKAKTQVSCGVITVSDTRTRETDTSGQLILLLDSVDLSIYQMRIFRPVLSC